MDNWIIISMVIAGLLVLFALILAMKTRKMKKNGMTMKTDYRALFFMGITFSGTGVALATSTGNPGLYGISAMGIIYMIIGIVNRDKWENHTG